MSVYAGPEISNDGLVLHLDAANRRSYPGSGTTWFDLSGNGYDFTLNNTPAYANNIFTFDGVNETATSISTFPIQISNTDFTLRVVFYTSSVGSNDGMLMLGSGAFNAGGKGLDLRKRGTAQLEFTVSDGISSGIRTSVTGNYTNVWTDLTITFLKSTESKYYINGVFGATTSYSGEITIADTYTFTIGRGGDSFFPGSISTVSLYNRVLSASEIQQNFNAHRGRFGI
jgi:hypothetical protein